MEFINPLVTAAGPEYAFDESGGGEGGTAMLSTIRAVVELGLRVTASDLEVNCCDCRVGEPPLVAEPIT